MENTVPYWLHLAGEADRDFSTNGTQQYTVAIEVPDTAAEGDYTFRLDMVGVDNPDEFYSQGQPVIFNVPSSKAPPPPPVDNKPKGYNPAVVGALIGGLASTYAAYIVGDILLLIFGVYLTFLPLLAIAGIVCAGAGFGSSFALRMRSCDWDVITGRIGAGVTFVLTIGFLVVFWEAIFPRYRNYDSGSTLVLFIAIPILLALAGLIARAATRLWKAKSL
jgi:hypothetical protein